MTVTRQIEAEAALLGAYLRNADLFFRYPTRADAFTDRRHAEVYAAIAATLKAGDALDLVTVGRAGAPVAVAAECMEQAFESHAPSYYRIVLEAQRRRALVQAARELAAAAENADEEPGAALERVQRGLERDMAAVAAGESPLLGDLEGDWLETVLTPDRQARVTLGMEPLVGHVPALPRGELTVLGARPGVGKSAVMGHVASVNARAGRHVFVASAEMTIAQLLGRWKAAQLGMPLWKVERGKFSPEEWRRAKEAPLPPIRVCDKAGMTTQMVADIASRLHASKPLDLLVVDHLHHLSDPLEKGETRYQQIGRMTSQLKALAKRLNCAALVLCQLNRQAADEVPTMAHLRDAGTIEEFANVVLLLHRREAEPGVLEVHVAKHRNGRAGGFVRVSWEPETMRLGEAA